MVTSEENPCAKVGSKYFIGYKNNEDNTMLGESCSKQRVGFLKIYDGTESLSPFVEDEKLLKR